jgi:hypothetical protein
LSAGNCLLLRRKAHCDLFFRDSRFAETLRRVNIVSVHHLSRELCSTLALAGVDPSGRTSAIAAASRRKVISDSEPLRDWRGLGCAVVAVMLMLWKLRERCCGTKQHQAVCAGNSAGVGNSGFIGGLGSGPKGYASLVRYIALASERLFDTKGTP